MQLFPAGSHLAHTFQVFSHLIGERIMLKPGDNELSNQIVQRIDSLRAYPQRLDVARRRRASHHGLSPRFVRFRAIGNFELLAHPLQPIENRLDFAGLNGCVVFPAAHLIFNPMGLAFEVFKTGRGARAF